jgi:hypothetical protein
MAATGPRPCTAHPADRRRQDDQRYTARSDGLRLQVGAATVFLRRANGLQASAK